MRSHNSVLPLATLLTVLALAPWLAVYWNASGNADNLWLAHGCDLILRGKAMTAAFYEQNLPFAAFLYLPSVMLSRLGMPLDRAIFAWTLVFTIIVCVVIAALAQKWPLPGKYDWVAPVYGVLVSGTIMSASFFGERDHFIALALVAITFVQASLTWNIECPRFAKLPVLVVGGLILAIKPFYLLLPGLLILHRAVMQKRWQALFGPDALVLATVAVVELAAIALFFPDYLSHIVPEAALFYAGMRDDTVLIQIAARYIAASAVVLVLLTKAKLPAEKFRLAALLAVSALVCIVPFIAQGKGYAYHLLPATLFLFSAIAIWLSHLLGASTSASPFSVGMACLLLLVGCYTGAPLRAAPPSRAQYRELPLTQLARSCGHPSCNVYMFAVDFELPQKVVYYAGANFSSRFGANWFLGPLIAWEAGRAPIPKDSVQSYRRRFSQMTADDFAQFKPQIVMLGRFAIAGTDFDFPAWFSANDDFRREWRHYRKTEIVEAPFDAYVPNSVHNRGQMLRFDVYRRMDGGGALNSAN